MNHILLYLIVGTRGGFNRGRIINALLKKPMNLNQLSKKVDLDYKTVQHHIDLLVENRCVQVVKKGSYGAMYFIPEDFDKEDFGKIWDRFG